MYQHWWNEDLRIDGKRAKYRKIISSKKQIRLLVRGIVIDEEYQKYFDNMYEALSLKLYYKILQGNIKNSQIN